MADQPLSRWARSYLTGVTLLGFLAIAESGYKLYASPIGWNWFVLAILTLISGSATVKLPSVPATISISETFVVTSVLLFGPAAGTLTVALDALIISLWLARKGHPLYRIIFNVSALPASVWLAAHAFYSLSSVRPLSSLSEAVDIGALLLPLTVFTLIYYLLNSWLIAFAISFEKRTSPHRVWRDNFAWLSLNYFGGASVAALLVTYTRHIDFAYLAFVLPLLAVLYFTFSMSMGRVEDANRHLTELNSLYMSTIETLAMAIDAKDQITHGHIRRVQQYATGLARALGVKDVSQIRAIEAASLLHDMGKLAVPEYILNKPGSLTPVEFEKMKLHATVGADILSAIDFPYPVVPIVRHHHENWDGSGYPQGLRGTDIPMGARVLAVVDCFDALTSDRPYRPRLSDAEAIKILLERRGTMYDPLVVDKFLDVHDEIAPQQSEPMPRRHQRLSVTAGASSTNVPGHPAGGLDDITASTEETLVLYELARSLTGHLDLQDAGELISKHIRRIIPASTCVLYLYDSGSDELFAAHAAGDNAAHFSGIRIVRGQRLTGWVAANLQTIINSDPVLDLGEVARSMRPRLRSCLSTPLVSAGSLTGVLTLYSPNKDAFTEDHHRIIEVIAKQVAPIMLRTTRNDQSGTFNSKDPLVGLPNIQHLRRFVTSELSSGGGANPLSVIYIDFQKSSADSAEKPDSTGRLTVEVLESVKQVLRTSDILFRYSQDEIVVLLTDTDFDTALVVAKRISISIEDVIQAARSVEEGRSIRIGVSTAPADGLTAQELVNAARLRKRRLLRHAPAPPSIH